MNSIVRTYTNETTLLLIFSILLSATACTIINKNNGRIVTADAPWYNAEIIDFKPIVDNSKQIDFMHQSLAGADDSNIAVFSNGSYKISVGMDDIEYNEWSIKLITLLDRNTKQIVKTLNIYDVINNGDYPLNAIYSNGVIIVFCNSWDSKINKSVAYEYEINPYTEEVLIIREFGIHDTAYQMQSQYSFNVGEYRIEPERASIESAASYFVLRVFSPDGSMTTVDIKDTVEGVYNIPFILALDESTALVPAELGRTYKFYILDLKDCSLSVDNDNYYSWINMDELRSAYSSMDGKLFFTTAQGISRLDLKEKEVNDFFDYDMCNMNRYYATNLQIADCSENTILLCGKYNSSNIFTSRFIDSFIIIELTKADKNPHVGKTILELYIPENEWNGILSETIIKYNNTADDCFIQVTHRYSKDSYLQSYYRSSNADEYEINLLKADAQVSYDLSMDIINGEGPDILINTSGLGQLNNENYLVDLSTYIQELDSDKYYQNIIDGAKTDSKLFQMPICFTVEGIQTDDANSGITGVGFTTGEYEEFLYDTLNGKDVIGLGQAQYFALLFNNMSDSFIKNGMVDLTGPEFSELAQFVKNNVQQNSTIWEDSIVDPNELFDSDLATRNNKAYYCNCPGISGYFVKRARIKDGTAILGLPSSDGRGPMFGTKLSVAVSANAVNKEACIEFVKMMLADEIQKELVLNDNFVINKEALRQGLIEAVDYFNSEEGQNSIFEYSLGTYVSINTKFTTEDIDNLEEVIQSCSTCDSVDAAINMIIIEEMPAYFLGQKDLDSVVTIIQDRAQKVLDERG